MCDTASANSGMDNLILRSHRMTKAINLIAVFLSAVGLLFVDPFGRSESLAATIVKTNVNPSFGCSVQLVGTIEEGDAEALRQLIEPLYIQSLSDEGLYGETLCLNSPGGNFAEAIVMAEYVRDFFASTIVEPNATCESACAIIFLSSRNNSTVMPGGRVGLHAPRLVVPTTTYTDREILEAYDLAIQTIGRIVDLGTLTPFAISQLTGTPNSSMFYPETIGDLARIGMPFPYRSMPVPDIPLMEILDNACHWAGWTQSVTSSAFSIGAPFARREILDFYDFEVARRLFASTPVSPARIQWEISGNFAYRGAEEYVGVCIARISFAQEAGGDLEFSGGEVIRSGAVTLSHARGGEIDDVGEAETFFEDWKLFDPQENYAVAAVGPGLPPRALEQRLTDGPPYTLGNLASAVVGDNRTTSMHDECDFGTWQSLEVFNVQDYVNMRYDLGSFLGRPFEAPISQQIPLGARVPWNGFSRFVGTPAQNAACNQACEMLDTQVINWCYENNIIWFGVMYQHAWGEVSAKYLRPVQD